MASPEDIWLVDFGEAFPEEPAHHRPAVMVGPHPIFEVSVPQVLVVPLTTRRRDLTVHIEVVATSDTGLDVDSYAQCELVRAISRRRLVHRLGSIAPDDAGAIRFVLAALLGI